MLLPDALVFLLGLDIGDSAKGNTVYFVRNDAGNYVVNSRIGPTADTFETLTIRGLDLPATATVSISNVQDHSLTVAYKLTYNPWKDWLGRLSFLTEHRRQGHISIPIGYKEPIAQIDNVALYATAIVMLDF